MKKQFKVTFNEVGNHVCHEWRSKQRPLPEGYTQKDNYEFINSLRYVGYSLGRSAINIIWELPDGKQVTSGMNFINELFTNKTDCDYKIGIEGLWVYGTFTFKKQGTAVLLTFVK